MCSSLYIRTIPQWTQNEQRSSSGIPFQKAWEGVASVEMVSRGLIRQRQNWQFLNKLVMNIGSWADF